MIAVECPKCATAMQIPDTAAGARGKCRKCGGIVLVPGRHAKICVGCGIDVSGSARFRSEAGGYRCEKCNEKELAAAQDRQIRIDVATDEFNRAKGARKTGNIILLAVWTPLVLFGVFASLAHSASPELLAGAVVGSLISYTFPFLIISLVWPAYRKNSKKLGVALQRLIDGHDVGVLVTPAQTANNACIFLFVMFLIAAILQVLRWAGADLEYHGRWWQNLPVFGDVFSGIGVFVALFFLPTRWSSLMATRQPFKILGLIGGFGLIAWAITFFLYAQR